MVYSVVVCWFGCFDYCGPVGVLRLQSDLVVAALFVAFGVFRLGCEFCWVGVCMVCLFVLCGVIALLSLWFCWRFRLF